MRKLRPTTPGQRGTIFPSYKSITTRVPHKALTRGQNRKVGRSAGRISMRHRGGGHKRLWRNIDFKYDKYNVPAKIETIEYDPNRSGFIALLCYEDGEKRYTLLPKGLKVGDKVVTKEKAPLKAGNRMLLKNIPVGTSVYNVELNKNGGAKIVRSAGNTAEVLAHDGGFVTLKLPSSEVRKVVADSYASIGEVSNEEHKLRVIGKAGRKRKMGRRPVVRGSAMNPVDHPHGGGEGRAGRGRKRAKSKWGKPTGKKQKTRKPKKQSNKYIVSRRKVGKRR